jgi:hypothetical protein
MEEMGQNRDCSEGCQALTELAGAVNTIVGTTEIRLKRLEDGLANNIAFQKRVTAFCERHDATEVEREKQLNKRDQEIKDALGNYHALQQDRQWWIMFGMSVLALVLMIGFGLFAIPPAIQSIRDLLKSDIHLPHFVVQGPASATARNRQPAQDAGGFSADNLFQKESKQ